MLWNIYPFHPFQNNNSNSNRTPLVEEVSDSIYLFWKVLDIFKLTEKNIISIGRKSQQILKLPEDKYIRHPANGGGKLFKEQIEKYYY